MVTWIARAAASARAAQFADGLVQERFLWLAPAVAWARLEGPVVSSWSTGRDESCADAVHGAGATSRNGPTLFPTGDGRPGSRGGANRDDRWSEMDGRRLRALST